MLRLSGLDADAESAVRVIGFFDRLITERAGLESLVRSTSELAIAADVLLEHASVPSPQLDDPTPIELVLSGNKPDLNPALDALCTNLSARKAAGFTINLVESPWNTSRRAAAPRCRTAVRTSKCAT